MCESVCERICLGEKAGGTLEGDSPHLNCLQLLYSLSQGMPGLHNCPKQALSQVVFSFAKLLEKREKKKGIAFYFKLHC